MTDTTGVPDAAPPPSAPRSSSPATEPGAPDATAARQSGGTTDGAWPKLRPLVLRLHFYAGLLVAPLLLVTALSGFAYALSFQAEKIVYRHELTVAVPDDGERLPLERQVDAARAVHPDLTVSAVWAPADADDSTRVLFADPSLDSTSKSQAVFVDPYTAQVRGALVSYGGSGALPLRTWLSEFHRHLHLGEPGRVYSELAASWLWVIALGGVLLWVGRRRSRPGLGGLFLLRRGAPKGRSRTLNRHAVVGIWAAVGLCLLSATGLTWSTYAGVKIGEVQDALGGATPAVTAEVTPGAGAPDGGHGGHEGHTDGAVAGDGIGVDAAVRAAERYGVDTAVKVTLPTEGTGYVVAERDAQVPVHLDSVSLDPRTGEVIDSLSFADYPLLAQLTRFGIDAHMGVMFGLANQLVLAALTAVVVLLIAWGYSMWWQRRPVGRRTGRPYARGSLRALPARVLVPLVLATVLAGWFVPLLGISLLAFLAIDVVLGALSRRRAVGRG